MFTNIINIIKNIILKGGKEEKEKDEEEEEQENEEEEEGEKSNAKECMSRGTLSPGTPPLGQAAVSQGQQGHCVCVSDFSHRSELSVLKHQESPPEAYPRDSQAAQTQDAVTRSNLRFHYL